VRVEGSNCIVTSNIIRESGRGYAGGYGINTGMNCVVSGNKISTKSVGLAYSQPNYGIKVDGNSTVTGNTVESYGTGRFEYGVYQSAGKYTVISGNILAFCYTGIRVNGPYAQIENNILKSCGFSNSPGIQITACNFSIISGNNLYDNDRGIRLYRTCNSTISDNIIDANDATYGIYEDTAPCDFNSISFNNMLLSSTPTTSITILKASGNSSALFNHGCYKSMWTHLMANPIAGAQYCNATTGDTAIYSGAAWIWTHG
jgi:parallel beta-helix repeat protein